MCDLCIRPTGHQGSSSLVRYRKVKLSEGKRHPRQNLRLLWLPVSWTLRSLKSVENVLVAFLLLRKNVQTKVTSGRKGLFYMGSQKQSPTRRGRHGDSQGIPSAGAGSWSITLFPHTRSWEWDQEVGEVANSQHAPHFSDTLLAPGSLLLLNFPQLPKQSYQPRTKCSKEPSEDISY